MAVVTALRSHSQVVIVQERCCEALANICYGDGAETSERKQHVVTAGAIKAVVKALCSHLQVTHVQSHGCRALLNMCGGTAAKATAQRKCAAARRA